MTAAARAKPQTPVLRTASGEPPLGIGGLAFRDDQGDVFRPQASYAAAGWIGVLELEDGMWLSHPPGLRIDAAQFSSRETALRSAIARMIRKARRYARNGASDEGTHWTEGFAGRVIEWALSLKVEKQGLLQAASATIAASRDHPGSDDSASDHDRVIAGSASETSGNLNPPSDPIVTELIAAHRNRKIFPAGHTFSMTNPVINGHMVTLGSCSCGETFSYAYGSAGHERMDAAIEAHWQKFDATADKIDGRGQPIDYRDKPGNSDKPKKPRKQKSSPGAGGHSAPLASAPLPDRPDGADASILNSPRNEPAPIGAASTEVSEPLGKQALTWPSSEADPVREAGLHGGSLALSMAAEPDADWSPLLTAALDLAWREPPQVTEIQAAMLDFGKVYARGRRVERPILRWHGGKWKIAPWIISHFPPHKVYIEPFGGAGSVLLQKLPAITEVWNDLEGEVVNLFRVLRSRADDLARLIYLTPFSRQEYHSLYGECDDPVERARQFVARSFMGQSSKGALRKSGFDSRINPDGFSSRLNSLRAMPEEFHAIAERFRNVVIEQKPAEAIFAQYDRQDVLFYVDPPYLSDRAKHYTHELDEAGHLALLETLRALDGMAVLSGYRSELYDAALTDWRRIEIEAHADGGIDRTEVVWLNPACASALDQQMPALFDLASFDAVNTPPPSDMTESEA